MSEATEFFEKKCREAQEKSPARLPPSTRIRNALYLINKKEDAELFFNGYVELLTQLKQHGSHTPVEQANMNLIVHVGQSFPFTEGQMRREVLRAQQTDFQRGCFDPKRRSAGVIDEEGEGK